MRTTKKPPLIDEVTIKKVQAIPGEIDIEKEGSTLGTVATTRDGGTTWNIQDRPIFTAGVYKEDNEVFHNGSSWISLTNDNQTEPKEDKLNWKELEKFDADGILLGNIAESGSITVLVTGKVREKHLEYCNSSVKKALFRSKVILK